MPSQSRGRLLTSDGTVEADRTWGTTLIDGLVNAFHPACMGGCQIRTRPLCSYSGTGQVQPNHTADDSTARVNRFTVAATGNLLRSTSYVAPLELFEGGDLTNLHRSTKTNDFIVEARCCPERVCDSPHRGLPSHTSTQDVTEDDFQ